MRSIDVNCFINWSFALFLCEILLHETFDIDDTFGDIYELRNAWQKTKFPDKLIAFFASLFNIQKSTLIYYSMYLMQDEINNDMTTFLSDKHFPLRSLMN